MMFHLDSAIEDWRRRMADGGLRRAEVLEELESHLRDDIASQVSGGKSAQEAFDSSVAHLGGPHTLKLEFDKVNGAMRGRVKEAFFILAGIPNHHHPDPMNMTDLSSPSEPRWATYTKAAVFLAPAAVLWTFAAMFLMPRLQKICQEAGTTLPSIYQVTNFLSNHPVLVLIAMAAPFAVLEWRWARWPQFRRASLGGVVFLLNTLVIALITFMLVMALMAAPGLMHHRG